MSSLGHLELILSSLFARQVPLEKWSETLRCEGFFCSFAFVQVTKVNDKNRATNTEKAGSMSLAMNYKAPMTYKVKVKILFMFRFEKVIVS